MFKITLALAAVVATVSASDFFAFERLLQTANTQNAACTSDSACLTAMPYSCCANVNRTVNGTNSLVNKVCAPQSIAGVNISTNATTTW